MASWSVMLLAALFLVLPQEPELDALRARLKKAANERMAAERVPGLAISVIRSGQVVLFVGIGHADTAKATPITADTVFNVASTSKTVAAVGLLRLVEQGRLALHEAVQPRLPGFALPRSRYDADGVTLERILCHTAGLSIGGIRGFLPQQELPTLAEVLAGETRSCAALRLVHAPGDRFRYSGGGYMLAQLLAEEVTGRDFAGWMRDEVLRPLGMKSSGFGWSEAMEAAAATPYDRRGRVHAGQRYVGVAAAGLQASSADLARFAVALMPKFRPEAAEHVLSRAMLERMLRPRTRSDGDGEWGLGVIVPGFGGGGVFGHTGGTHGWISSLWLQPELGEGLVLLSNGTNADRFMDRLESVWVDDLARRKLPYRRRPPWHR